MSTRKNALYNVAYRVFSVFLPLVTAPYLSRVVGTTGVGLYSYAWNISHVFVLIGMLGLESYGVRAIARVKDDAAQLHRTFSEIWKMQLMVSSLVLAGWLGYVFLFAGQEKTIALHLTMMSLSCLVNLDWCLMGLDQFKPIALKNTAIKLLAAAAVFAFVHGPEDLWIYAFAWSLATLVGCISCWTTLRGKIRVVPVSWKAALAHFKPCAVLFVSVLAISIFRSMDKVMVGGLSTMEQNGYYENAEKIIFCLSGFITAIGTVMLPKVSAMFKRGEADRVRTHLDASMQIVMCMVCALSFGVAAVAKNFAPLFFGEDFTYSGTLMIPLSFTLIGMGFANVVRTQWILPQGKDHIFVTSVVAGAVINLVLNFLLIPPLGAAGAIVGTLAAEFCLPTVHWIYLRKELPHGKLLRHALTYAALGFVMLLSVRLAGALLPFGGWLGLAVQVAVGGLVYGGLCLLLWIKTNNRAILRLIPGMKK